MKTKVSRLMAAAGLSLLAQPGWGHATNVLVDFAAHYSDMTPVSVSSNPGPAAVTQATGPLSVSLKLNFELSEPLSGGDCSVAQANYAGSISASSGSADASIPQLTLTSIELYDQFDALVGSPGHQQHFRNRLWRAGAFAGDPPGRWHGLCISSQT